MKEIISSILQAEEMADQLIGDATEKAKKIAADGEASSEAVKASAVKNFGAERKSALDGAEKKAQDCYKKIMDKAECEAEQLKANAQSKTEQIIDSIVKEIVK